MRALIAAASTVIVLAKGALAPYLGLIASDDGGRHWTTVFRP